MKTKISEFGFIHDITNEEYHNLEGISKSGLDKLERSPAHYKYPSPRSNKPTPQMIMGTAIHTAILEPERYDEEYCIVDAENRQLKAYKVAKEEHGEERTLLLKDHIKVMGMREAVEENPQAQHEFHKPGNVELSAAVTDPETGVIIRCRYDWVSDDHIAVDVKKTQDIRHFKFRKSVENYRYHVQAAMYSFIYEQVTGHKLKEFWFLAVEEESPHSTQMFKLDDEAFDIGHHYFRRDLLAYANCLEKDAWPHPETNNGIISLSNWVTDAYENELLGEIQ